LTGDDAERVARQMLVAELVRKETDTKALAAGAEVKYHGTYDHIMGKDEAAPAKPDAK
jgi:hypothetical protein